MSGIVPALHLDPVLFTVNYLCFLRVTRFFPSVVRMKQVERLLRQNFDDGSDHFVSHHYGLLNFLL